MNDRIPMTEGLDALLEHMERKDPDQTVFHQAVREVMEHVAPLAMDHSKYRDAAILRRLLEPDRIVSFRVTWEDDEGRVQVNRGYRVQYSNALGPYKGGLRFHPTVNVDVLKFLGFEQCFKNALTGLSMGGGKGGSDFDPRGRSEREIMRFCQSFMTALFTNIGSDMDVPAGDIGVGSREVGFLFGQYKRLTRRVTGVLTGKAPSIGGSPVRPESTGYGAVQFCAHVLEHADRSIEHQRIAVSGSGNVAIYATEKAIDLGATVVTLSDSKGTVHDPNGVTREKLEFLKELKFERRGRISEYAEKYDGVEYLEGAKPWGVDCTVALPCATENELNEADARQLTSNGLIAVSEGANMPCTPEAIEVFRDKGVYYAPGKASNAGGVAVSGLEMSQNAMGVTWDRERVTQELDAIMRHVHRQCVEHGRDGEGGRVDYMKGANVAGFVRLADAIIAQGLF